MCPVFMMSSLWKVALLFLSAVVALHVVAANPVNSDRACLICKAVATTAVGSAQDLGPGSVQDALSTLCATLIRQERVLCSTLSEESFSADSSTEQCAALGKCPFSSGLIGAERCTWGPSYWCQSSLHAHSCGAVTHCQERVWESGVPPA